MQQWERNIMQTSNFFLVLRTTFTKKHVNFMGKTHLNCIVCTDIKSSNISMDDKSLEFDSVKAYVYC